MPGPTFQDWLDRMERSFFEDDFATYAEGCLLPLAIVTGGGATVVADEDMLRAGFEAWRDMLTSLRATHMVRKARDVEYLSPTLMIGRYETDLLRDWQRLVPTFTSSATLVLVGDRWKAVSVISGLSNPEFPINLPKVADEAADTRRTKDT